MYYCTGMAPNQPPTVPRAQAPPIQTQPLINLWPATNTQAPTTNNNADNNTNNNNDHDTNDDTNDNNNSKPTQIHVVLFKYKPSCLTIAGANCELFHF